jgi:hypothetical protein
VFHDTYKISVFNFADVSANANNVKTLDKWRNKMHSLHRQYIICDFYTMKRGKKSTFTKKAASHPAALKFIWFCAYSFALTAAKSSKNFSFSVLVRWQEDVTVVLKTGIRSSLLN